MATLSISNLRKSFGTTTILHDISLEVEHGEFLVLVGPSGCGKSTLLRLIAGLEEDHHGQIAMNGRRIDTLPPRDRDIAMVFQNYALYPHLTVRDNLGFPLRLRQIAKADARARIDRAAAQLGLSALLDRYPRELSGGQRQRVAMGRAIVRDPRLFLFDEPLSNLDAKLRVHMRTEIRSLHSRLGSTSIYVTHDQVEAMTMADRIVVMKDGHIAQIGRPLDLYDHPANLFVAGFIGSPNMNFIDLAWDGAKGGLAGRDGILLPAPDTAADRRKLVFGIRPEHLSFTDRSDGGLPAEVRAVEPTGAETHVQLSVAGSSWAVTTADRPDLKPGDRLFLAPKPGKAHLFDAETGARLAA